MQEVEECSFDAIECHGCTELMSAIGRMTKDIEATPSLWHTAGDTSQPVARPVGCRRLMLVFPCLRCYWIRGEWRTNVQPQLFFARRPFLWLLMMAETGCKSELLVGLGVRVKHFDIKKAFCPVLQKSLAATAQRTYVLHWYTVHTWHNVTAFTPIDNQQLPMQHLVFYCNLCVFHRRGILASTAEIFAWKFSCGAPYAKDKGLLNAWYTACV